MAPLIQIELDNIINLTAKPIDGLVQIILQTESLYIIPIVKYLNFDKQNINFIYEVLKGDSIIASYKEAVMQNPNLPDRIRVWAVKDLAEADTIISQIKFFS